MKVYISSTYADLTEHRGKVYEKLRSLGHDIARMEDYVASDERPADKCIADVQSCDLYVGIFAWRYGFVPPGHDRSITELEYRAASEAGKPRLIFLVDDAAPWPRNQIEGGTGGQKIEQLRAELATNHVVSFFKNAEDLARLVTLAVAHRAQQRLDEDVAGLRTQQAGEQRARAREGERVVNLPPIEVARFAGREVEQVDLRRFLADAGVRLVSVVGRGGMGKSALASRVLAALEQTARTGVPDASGTRVDGVLYLSSRSTGIDLDRIYSGVQRLLNQKEADTLAAQWARTDATVTERVDALLGNLRGGRYLILLDGMDAVIAPDGAMEEGIRAFIEGCLFRAGPTTLIVTSRVDLAIPPQALPASRVIRLRSGLKTEEAVGLLESLDPQGELGLHGAAPEELRRAAELTGGIPRALEILAGILQQDPSATLRDLLADERALGSQTVESLVAEGYHRLGAEEQHVIQAMAILDRPVHKTAIAYVLHPWFPLLDVPAALKRLAGSYFVATSRGREEYSLQPLDREHAYRQIPEGAAGKDGGPPYSRTGLELRAADFYASLRKPAVEWRSIEDLAPAVYEFEHRVRGGDYDRALEVMDAVDGKYLFMWGHYNRIVELRKRMLGKPARPGLRAANVASLATCCQVLTQFDAAIQYYEEAVEIARDSGDRAAEVTYIGNLGRLYRNLGYIDKALESSKQALAFAQEQGNRQAEGVWSDRLGLAYAILGRLEEAAALYDRAISIAREVHDRQTEGAALSNLGLVRQDQGRVEEEECFAKSLAIAREIGDRRGEPILLGRLGTTAHNAGDFKKAFELHAQALVIARELNERREESYQLLGMGRAALGSGDLPQAEQHLRAARDLNVPETSHIAALALSLTLLRQHDPAAAEAFRDAERRCRERLQRCDRLYRGRYTLATAMLGSAVCAAGWANAEQRQALLAPVLAEYEKALQNCPGRGIITATLYNVRQFAAAGMEGFESVTSLLERALETAALADKPQIMEVAH